MIHRCRPDLDVACFCHALQDASAASALPELGGRALFPVPMAREGLRWFLDRAGIGAGDEVALPALLCDAVADAILAVGATPVTFGVSEDDFSPSADFCERALTPATRAVVVPHLYGAPADLAAFRTLCDVKDCLLIEDCAPCVFGDSGGYAVGSVGDCSIYSFQYDKPLSLGWGGAVSLSPAGHEQMGEPSFPAMSEGDDRLLAASFLVQHTLTEAARLGGVFLSMTCAVEYLLAHRGEVDAVLALAAEGDPAAELAAWCDEHIELPKPSAAAALLACVKRMAKRVLPAALRRRAGRRGPSPARVQFDGTVLRPGGLCERLLAVQFREGEASVARARVAAIYGDGLSREAMVVPRADRAPHWLRFPVALRAGRAARERVSRRAARQLGVEIWPYTWPVAVHRVPRLHGKVRPGPGSDETARLIDGLLNLPVHSQMGEDAARRLVELLNSG